MFLRRIFPGMWLLAQVLFHVNNGAGRVTAAYEPRGTGSLCDGRWHKLQANKSKHRLSLAIDGNAVQVDNPYLQSTSADTNDPLYVGGYPGGYRNTALPFSPSRLRSSHVPPLFPLSLVPEAHNGAVNLIPSLHKPAP